jgi:Kef-type K+ transport system membrane component KefB/nucleotide-binding universal stress UspA family protein
MKRGIAPDRGPRGHLLLCAAAAFALTTGEAIAADGGARAGGGSPEVVFLAQLVVLMLVGRLLGEVMIRIGQPSVMGQLLAGVLLGPSVLGLIWPQLQHVLFPAVKEQKAMLDAVSQFGILLLLLLTGMETDLALVRRVGRAAITVSIAGVAVPFACGLGLGFLMPDTLLPDPGKRLLTALFLGTALSISSIKIVAATLRELGFARRDLGQVIVSSAILEDTIGWVIIAITFSLAEAGSIDVAGVSKSVIGTAVFMVASFTIGRRVVFDLIRWTNDNFESEFAVITAILVIMGVMALTTQLIGVHTVLGAFVAGVLIGQSPILTGHIDEQLRGLITAFFMPVFFGVAGLSADLTILTDWRLLLMALALIAIASVGKFAGAFVGGELGGLTRREAFALACGMNARGSTEVIVATIGLSLGALTQDLFTMIVAMAVTTTLAMPPMLRFALKRVPMRRAERERLEREEVEAKSFVSDLERLLVAADDSANGRLAAHLAGLLAGARGLPITIVPRAGDGRAAEETARAAAEASRAQIEDGNAARIDLSIRKPESSGKDVLADEAEKGYDLLIVGIEDTRAKGGTFHQDATDIAAGFEGPLVMVVAGGEHLRSPAQGPSRILVPVSGTDVSRRAADVAIALARSRGGSITFLYVAGTAGTRARSARTASTRREQRAVLDDIVENARRHAVTARAVVHSDVAPVGAILMEAKTHDLIVIGASRRPGERLFLGETAAAVLEHAEGSVMFLAS